MEKRMKTTSIIRISKITILGLLIFASACTPLVVIVQPTSVASSPTALPTIALTSTFEPTALPISSPTAIPQPTATSASGSTSCRDSAQYISDDGLDGTTYPPNTPFTKTWTVKNTGTCIWDSSYLVFHISGTSMTQQPGYWIIPQGQTVAPGQTMDINVGMTSPVENGNSVSYWGLKKVDGQFMPIKGGASGNSFYVKIKVSNDASNAGNITAASIDIAREEGSGVACSAEATYFVHAYITTDGPMTATYEINSTTGQIAAGNFQTSLTGQVSPVVTGTLVFDQADTKTINLRFVGPYPYPGDITVNIRVNGGEWHNTKLSCQ
jgi:Ig-like domain-containing protein